MMALELIQYLVGLASGSLVGFTLGLVGGGESFLAIPLVVCLLVATAAKRVPAKRSLINPVFAGAILFRRRLYAPAKRFGDRDGLRIT